MYKNNPGLLIVLSGPSGAGKDSVLKRIFQKRDNLKLSVSYTTRSPREGEVNGKDYNFVSSDEFEKIILNNQMLEWAKYCDNYYGTPIFEIHKELELGNSVILEIEVQGAQQIMKKCPKSLSVFIAPPSLRDLRLRLINRGLDSLETIDKRINEAKNEILLANQYDYIVVNDNIDKCAESILKIIDVEYMKSSRTGYIINEVLKK